MRCSVRVFGHNQPFGGAMCAKPGKVEVNGRHYCATHDPAAELRRRQKSDAKYHAEREAANQKHAAHKEMQRRAECFHELLEALILARSMCGLKGDVHERIDAVIARCKGEE